MPPAKIILEPVETTKPSAGDDASNSVEAKASPAPSAPPPPAEEQAEAPPAPLADKGLHPVNQGTPGKAAGDLVSLHQLAVESYASIDSYIVRFRRREQVGGKDQPEELMLLKFRKQPWSVYFKWLEGTCKGREVVYVKGMHGNKLHTLVAAGDIPLVPGGKKLSFSIDSALVRSKSRHSIADAGIGSSIEKFGNLVEKVKRKDQRSGSLKYLGLVERPEFETPVEGVLQSIPPKAEPGLPRGGKRFWYFDTRLRFPVLLVTVDEKNQEVEYYCYDRWLFPGQISDDEFDPDVLWKEK